ncbi:MAG: KdsC family phosphatase [Candidatus Nitrosopumilus sp. bin_7KS]
MNKNLIKKCMKLKLITTDVDGVLTDGGRYYGNNGESMKKFHTRDGMGVNILLRNNIKTGIITKEKSKIVSKWADEMNVSLLFMGQKHKEQTLLEICKKYNYQNSEISYIGDDVNDIKLMKLVGFSAAPNDAIDEVKNNADYVCSHNGGDGSFREIVDLILKIKFGKNVKWYD